ncbi:MAG TPA: DUF2203 domain-containing protein [Candidatus Binataceae bacterium]|nr:DUF2203 domain-containing protein [Candidatus Binataceae bacterium]
MHKHRFDKLFSAAEANELIPRLEILMRQLQVQANALRARVSEMARFDDKLTQLELPDAIARYPELRPFAARMAEIASEIESMGCFLKDIDQGLVDFPFLLDEPDEEVSEEDAVAFMCWQFGEQRIIAWHPVDGGFAERRPLPGAPRQLLN